MGDVAVFEAAQHIGDGVYFADVCQKLIAQPFAFGGAFYKARNVDKGEAGGDNLF